jgi:hypothetical protein
MLHVAWQDAGGNNSRRIHSLFVNTILKEAIQKPSVQKLSLMRVQNQLRV